jgi:hypothetical protein
VLAFDDEGTELEGCGIWAIFKLEVARKLLFLSIKNMKLRKSQVRILIEDPVVLLPIFLLCFLL